MSTLQVRDVPADVHRTLKARAAASGRSLSEYVLEILARGLRAHAACEVVVIEGTTAI